MFIFSFSSCIFVSAGSIDTSREGSIQISYQYSDFKFANAQTYIYKVADIDTSGHFVYIDPFLDQTDSLDDLTASQWSDLSKNLVTYVKNQNINPLQQGVTDQDGKYIFNHLSTGLYLVIVDSVYNKDYQYSSLPSLISIPNYNEITNQYMYDINLIMKTEAKYLGNQVNDDNTTSPPNTYDAIVFYIGLFIVSLILFLGLVCYVKKVKKEGSKDEKKKTKM